MSPRCLSISVLFSLFFFLSFKIENPVKKKMEEEEEEEMSTAVHDVRS